MRLPPVLQRGARAEALFNMRKMGIESLVKRGYATLGRAAAAGTAMPRALRCRSLIA
ncbi:MAG: hypothetical protein ACLR56_01875 [Oscillospiraceae bacterium]